MSNESTAPQIADLTDGELALTVATVALDSMIGRNELHENKLNEAVAQAHIVCMNALVKPSEGDAKAAATADEACSVVATATNRFRLALAKAMGVDGTLQ
ncbi:MAG: hypothetical protein OXO52_22290 [Rhodospirillales bacterium]|nr:hypothetical protein [Rhodospirillales bacterium]MDE0380748.1 hypothetical protein [Rhodospirillales bacterium]